MTGGHQTAPTSRKRWDQRALGPRALVQQALVRLGTHWVMERWVTGRWIHRWVNEAPVPLKATLLMGPAVDLVCTPNLEPSDFNCVIDWAFSSSVPATELLAPPGLPCPKIWPGQSLAASYRRGFEQDTGQKQQWEGTETVWYFQRFLSMDSYQDYHYFDRLCTLASENEGQPADTLRLFTNARENADLDILGWPRCRDVLANTNGQRYFANKSGTDREVVARKLMVMEVASRGDRWATEVRQWAFGG